MVWIGMLPTDVYAALIDGRSGNVPGIALRVNQGGNTLVFAQADGQAEQAYGLGDLVMPGTPAMVALRTDGAQLGIWGAKSGSAPVSYTGAMPAGVFTNAATQYAFGYGYVNPDAYTGPAAISIAAFVQHFMTDDELAAFRQDAQRWLTPLGLAL